MEHSHEHDQHRQPEASDNAALATSEKLPKISDEAWHVFSTVCAGLTDEQIDQILTSHHQHGDAFAAFISLDSIDPTDNAVLESFPREYCGKHLISEPIEHHFVREEHWQGQLDQALADTPIPREFISIDYDKLAKELKRAYEIVELGQWRYLFH